ncbi:MULTISPECIES: dihydrodipicolinate synthase family protein [unclassified Streptomyces]|uniref:dihydrodipicolinate synthase family protein n=1 Tax=unclassified Streptomyces TaxID=2593676 RepID=UPI002E1A4937|nr:dihydrodipicolinate synthase family protein [Streptomyces sp. NBC_01023]
MDRSDVDWRGYWSALPTPFTPDGDVDEEALRAVIELYIGQGVHGLLVNGSTGEWVSQTPDERRHLAETAAEAIDGRVPLVVGVTAARTGVACGLAAHAERAGADAVMAAPAPGLRPTPAELRGYFEEVFAASALPGWLYNFPQDTATNLGVGQLSELADLPNVVAVKQSTPDIRELLATIEKVGDRLVVFGHLLSRLGLSLIAGGYGGDGHFGSGMLLGARQPAFFDLAWKGDRDGALRIVASHDALMERLRGNATDGYNWRFGGMQASLKASMNLMGQPGGLPRHPKLPITDPAALDAIRAALREAGLDVVA